MQIITIVVIRHFPSNSLFISDMSPIVDKEIPEGKHANPCCVSLAKSEQRALISTRFIKDLFQCNVL